MKLFRVASIGLICVLTCPGCLWGQENLSAKEESALESARDWLEIVDSGDYAASWEESAGYFQRAVTRQQWHQSMEAARAPLGDLLSREVASAEYTTALPGAPDGEYVVIQFRTSFENKESAVETVTPMLDSEGQWRVSGYHIR